MVDPPYCDQQRAEGDAEEDQDERRKRIHLNV
jgi:hypothetical protein